jgi:CHASE2 domain-containing sensor protein
MLYFQMLRSSLSKVRLWYFLLPLLLTVGLRESGATRQLDSFVLDRLLRMRPAEAMDDRIVLITIDETDLVEEPNKSTISDQTLARTINRIAADKPSAIGVDIIRDGNIALQLQQAYQSNNNVIGLAKLFEPNPLDPPLGLSSDRAGFGDYKPDADSLVRRAMLATFGQDQQKNQTTEYSFAFQISRLYLQKQGRDIQISPQQLKLGDRSISPFSVIDRKNKDFEILVNYRNVHPTFHQITLTEVLSGQPLNLQNKIVIIGYTAATKHDFINTSVIPDSVEKIQGSIYGIEYHGHIASQLVSTALNERSFIQPLAFWGDYLWIFTCIISSGLVLKTVRFKAPFWQLQVALWGYVTATGFSIYLLFLAGWFLPVGLTLTILIINVPMLLSFYRREQSLLAIAEKRRQAITETFNSIHNGPLQELSLLLQDVKSENISLPEVGGRLEKLNQQIRHIGESLQTDTSEKVAAKDILVLGNGDRVDLNTTLNELFYLVSDRTLQNNSYPNLSSLKVKIIDFQEVPKESRLSINDKRQLCQFLEEAIGNVGKYADGATRVKLLGAIDGNVYRLSIEDNGQGQISTRKGVGTKQSQRLADRLKGKFTRSRNASSAGVNCSIEWNLDLQKITM